MKDGYKEKCGLALLEATTALFVATVGFMGVFQMYDLGRDVLSTVQEQRIADRILQNEQAALKAQPFSSLTAVSDLPLSLESPELQHLPNATAVVTIQDVEGMQGTLKKVSASIMWTAVNGHTKKRELSTLIAARSLPQ